VVNSHNQLILSKGKLLDALGGLHPIRL
jgi:hypothetical protein